VRGHYRDAQRVLDELQRLGIDDDSVPILAGEPRSQFEASRAQPGR
jgi:hypothetical protein